MSLRSAPKKQPLCAILLDGLDAPHGTEMFACILATNLRKRGWRVEFHCAHYSKPKSVWTRLLLDFAIPVHHAGFWFFTKHYLPSRFAAWKFQHMIKKDVPDVIWSPTTDMLTCLALRGRKSQDAPLFFVHDPNDASASPQLPSCWPPVCNQITALSVHGNRQLAGAKKAYGINRPMGVVWPASVAPNCLPAPPQFRDGVIRFGQFGRLWSMKGSLFTVAAFAQCLHAGCKAELHFFGEGPQRREIEEMVSTLGVADSVFFHGSYTFNELDRLVGLIDVGLMTSLYEGFGLVMLELLSRGRPVISTDVGSSREVLEAMNAGVVVPRADTASLSEAMIAAACDPANMRQLGANGRAAWLKHFTPEAFTDRMLAFWREHGLTLLPE